MKSFRDFGSKQLNFGSFYLFSPYLQTSIDVVWLKRRSDERNMVELWH